MVSQFHLADLFEITADTVGDRVAILSDKDALTYTELNARADRLAASLVALGIKRGDKVGLYLMNCPEYIEAFLAAMKLGAVPFNVNYRYRAEELRYLFNNSDCAVVFHGAEFSDIVRDISGDVATLKLTVVVDDGSAADSVGSLRSEEHTSELQSLTNLVCRLMLDKNKVQVGLSVRIVELSRLPSLRAT